MTERLILDEVCLMDQINFTLGFECSLTQISNFHKKFLLWIATAIKWIIFYRYDDPLQFKLTRCKRRWVIHTIVSKSLSSLLQLHISLFSNLLLINLSRNKGCILRHVWIQLCTTRGSTKVVVFLLNFEIISALHAYVNIGNWSICSIKNTVTFHVTMYCLFEIVLLTKASSFIQISISHVVC